MGKIKKQKLSILLQSTLITTLFITLTAAVYGFTTAAIKLVSLIF